MKPRLLLIAFASGSLLRAEVEPENYRTERYRSLIDNSPFTDPIKTVAPPIIKELPNWSLIGVRKYRSEQFATVVNLKDRSQRIEIPGADAEELGFRLLEVEVARSFLETRVRVQKGKEIGWLEYRSKLLIPQRSPQQPVSIQKAQKLELPPVPGKPARYVPRPK